MPDDAPSLLSRWKGRRVLVLGATGFLGRHLVERLASLGAHPEAWGRARCDLTLGEPDLSGACYDDIFYLATYQGGGTFAARRQGEICSVNIRMALNALAAWQGRQPQARFISVGSSCAYPTRPHPMGEADFWEGGLHESVVGHGTAKRVLQATQAMLRRDHGLEASHYVLSTLVGEHDCYDAERAHVAAALIARIVAARRSDAPEVEIWGDGRQVREFLHVGDQVTRLLLAAMAAPSDLLNIGAGRGTTIRELAEAIARAAGYPGRLFFNPERFVGNPYKVLSSEEADRRLPPHSRLSLDQMMERTVTWYMSSVI